MKSISLRNVQKCYPKVTISYPDRIINQKITLLVGENGSGKSTLLKAILGLLRITGQIQIEGSWSYMPEHVHFPRDITVQTFLETLNPTVNMDLVHQFHLTKQYHKEIHKLSLGMRQKLNLIQALAQDSDWILLDEPTNGLDFEGVQKLVSYIASSSKQFLIATHHPDVFQSLEKDVITLDSHSSKLLNA